MESSLQIIAEVNTSHFGSVENALRACEVAKDSGAHFVKFQSWAPESLFTRTYLESRSVERRMYEKFALAPDVLKHLRLECKKLGVGFGSTAYSPEEASHLGIIEADFIKIASMDAVSPPIIRAAAETKIPTIISTGMATMTEIEQAVEDFTSAGGESLTLMHCTSIYPTPLKESSIGNIRLLQSSFPSTEIGFSDHTQGSSAAAAALGLGVRKFEKHFSLDNSKPGFDNSMAETREGLSQYASILWSLEQSIAQAAKEISAAEAAQARVMRRSAFFTSNLSHGEPLKLETLEFKRPGHGLSYRDVLDLLGKNLNRDVEVGEMLDKSFLDLH